MKRGIIYNNDYSIIIPNDEIWMTSWEIADLFYVTPISINHAIKRILKKTDIFVWRTGIMQMYIIWKWLLPCLSILTLVILSYSVDG